MLALEVAERRLVAAAEHDGEQVPAQNFLHGAAQLALALFERNFIADDIARVVELDLLRERARKARHLAAHKVRRERRARAALVARDALVAAKADESKAELAGERRAAVVQVDGLYPLVPAKRVVIGLAVDAPFPAVHGTDIMIQKHI